VPATGLLSFKQALIAADAAKLGWNPGTNHCQWLGVYCNTAQHVYLLDLSSQGLQGTLSDAVKLGALQQLQSIWLQGNQLAGTLPGSWFSLPSLQELMLYDNAIEVSGLRCCAGSTTKSSAFPSSCRNISICCERSL
jgi:hypothetical protein